MVDTIVINDREGALIMLSTMKFMNDAELDDAELATTVI